MDIFIKLFFSLFIFFIKLFIFYCADCAIDNPIKTSNGCELKYCSKSEFDSGACKINNPIIKIQWLNDIILFDYDKFRYGSFTINSKGDMIFECSAEQANGIRLFYWLKKDGTFYFKNQNGERISTKTIIVKYGNSDNSPLRYESNIIMVSINNKEYLLSISLWEGMVEL